MDRPTHSPTLPMLRAFEAGARLGSFTRAAHELHLTQAAVSRQVREMERLLGLRLFERARQRVTLSEDGKALLPAAIDLCRRHDAFVRGAAAAVATDQRLEIAVIPTFGTTWLAPRLPDYLERHPRTRLRVISRTERFDFRTDPVDCAIAYGRPAWAHARCTALFAEDNVAVVSPAMGAGLDASMDADPATGLRGATLLHVASRPEAWSLEGERCGLEDADPWSGHTFDTFAMAIEAAKAGLGAALVPRPFVEAELASGALRCVAEARRRPDAAYFVAVPESSHARAPVRDFVRWLVARAASPDPVEAIP